jgi:hypothetical protein
MSQTIALKLEGPSAVIPQSSDGSKIAVRIMGHLNPHLCERGYLINPNGKRFRLGQDTYEIRMTEGVVGFPERMALMATATKVGDNLMRTIECEVIINGNKHLVPVGSLTYEEIVRLSGVEGDSLRVAFASQHDDNTVKPGEFLFVYPSCDLCIRVEKRRR